MWCALQLQKIGQYLATEKYEFHDKVAAREQAIASGFDELRAKGAENEPVLQDSLDREVYREGIMTKVDVHADINGKLAHWTADKAKYVDKKEVRTTCGPKIVLLLPSAFAPLAYHRLHPSRCTHHPLGHQCRTSSCTIL